MMRRKLWLIFVVFMLSTTTCQSTQEGEMENETPVLPNSTTPAEDIFPRPTLTPPEPPSLLSTTPAADSYPPPAIPTGTPESYPPPTAAAIIEAYPAGELVWVLRPVGEQCADPNEAEYADLQEASAALAAIGVSVKASEMINLMVCSACSCPTSAHFRVQIDRADLPSAISLGWRLEE